MNTLKPLAVFQLEQGTMNKFTTILVPLVFFGFFIAVLISGSNSKDGKGDTTSAAIDELRDLQAIKHAPQVDQRTCAP
jgi:hypothetical protein